ncbi:Hypothetical_protein [Hexamita inflata]|uniref:Hypothetical_protein n=1 Tax=Hexamita inflata TaxID=28002 RepID=A0ABP1HRB0_9EUKA
MLADTLSSLNFTNIQILVIVLLVIVSIITLVSILVPLIVILLETLLIQLKKDILSFLNAPQNEVLQNFLKIQSNIKPINRCQQTITIAQHTGQTLKEQRVQKLIYSTLRTRLQQQVQILTTNDFQLILISQIQVVNKISKQKRLVKFTLHAYEDQNLELSENLE